MKLWVRTPPPSCRHATLSLVRANCKSIDKHVLINGLRKRVYGAASGAQNYNICNLLRNYFILFAPSFGPLPKLLFFIPPPPILILNNSDPVLDPARLDPARATRRIWEFAQTRPIFRDCTRNSLKHRNLRSFSLAR